MGDGRNEMWHIAMLQQAAALFWFKVHSISTVSTNKREYNTVKIIYLDENKYDIAEGSI